MGLFSSLLGKGSADFAGNLPADAVLLDVRSPDEYASGHVSGAISLPLAVIPLNIERVVPDKTSQIIVYCQSGARSAAAREHLLQNGYRNVINGGGVHALAKRMQRDILRC